MQEVKSFIRSGEKKNIFWESSMFSAPSALHFLCVLTDSTCPSPLVCTRYHSTFCSELVFNCRFRIMVPGWNKYLIASWIGCSIPDSVDIYLFFINVACDVLKFIQTVWEISCHVQKFLLSLECNKKFCL